MEDSKWFKEGQAAALEEKPRSACPYGARSAKALIWLEGYNRAADRGY